VYVRHVRILDSKKNRLEIGEQHDKQYGADKNVHGWSGFWPVRSNPEPALNQRAISAVFTAIWPANMLIPVQFDPA
jgi:hypothetical protein